MKRRISMRGRIKQILMKRRGKKNAITVAEIVHQIGEPQKGMTNPEARLTIRRIMDEAEIPIGSCSGGYYIITNTKEYIEYKANLLGRINGIRRRLVMLEKAWRK